MKGQTILIALVAIITAAGFAESASAMIHTKMGRFTSRDPLALRTRSPVPAAHPRIQKNVTPPKIERNLYHYVESAPTQRLDPRGLKSFRQCDDNDPCGDICVIPPGDLTPNDFPAIRDCRKGDLVMWKAKGSCVKIDTSIREQANANCPSCSEEHVYECVDPNTPTPWEFIDIGKMLHECPKGPNIV
jgi:hypothetical protein